MAYGFHPAVCCISVFDLNISEKQDWKEVIPPDIKISFNGWWSHCMTFPGVNSEYVLIRVWLLATWTIACQTPLPWNFPGKNTGVGYLSLLQGIFPTQGLIPKLLHLLHWQVNSLPLAPPGKPQEHLLLESRGLKRSLEACLPPCPQS